MGWPTVQQVVSQAALELGISSALDVGDPFASGDGNLLQLVGLLNRGGVELVDEHDWTHLRRDWAFLDQLNQRSYPLPPDFRDMVDQSGWNRSTRMPLGGPVSEQEWQWLASRQAGVVFNVLFRPAQGVLQLYPNYQATPSNAQINFAYKSSWWVAAVSSGVSSSLWTDSTSYAFGQIVRVPSTGLGSALVQDYFVCSFPGTSGGAAPAWTTTEHSAPIVDGSVNWMWWGRLMQVSGGMSYSFGVADAVSAAGDVLLFPKELLVAKLRLLWLNAKGFDSQAAERDYRNAFAAAVGNDTAAPSLDLGGGPARDLLLGPQNFPITGFGT